MIIILKPAKKSLLKFCGTLYILLCMCVIMSLMTDDQKMFDFPHPH